MSDDEVMAAAIAVAVGVLLLLHWLGVI